MLSENTCGLVFNTINSIIYDMGSLRYQHVPVWIQMGERQNFSPLFIKSSILFCPIYCYLSVTYVDYNSILFVLPLICKFN